MLRPLILLILFAVGAYSALRWLRTLGLLRLKGSGSRELDPRELKTLTRRARNIKPLKRALDLRNNIWDATKNRKDRDGLRTKVDDAIRRLDEQEKLHTRIIAAIRDTDVASEREHADDIQIFEEQQVMLSRLNEQAHVLLKEGERTILELSNLHLALLDVSASESVLNGGGALTNALSDLESLGSTARHQAEAEAEVARFLASRERLLSSKES